MVVGDDGSILSCVEIPVHATLSPDGGVEQDPEELWRSILEAGRSALAAARVPVSVVGLANQGETVLAWDLETSRPLSTAISWQDRRSVSVTARLTDEARELEALTGLPLDPYFAAPKMVWLREHATVDGVVTTSDAWLIHRLTGRFMTDVTTASRTMLLDLDARAWSPRAVGLFGLASESMPEIGRCDEVVGETQVFGPRLPLAGLAVDQQAALFADGCLTQGAAKCTYGTGAFLLANTGSKPVRSRSGLASSVAWDLGGDSTYCLDGQVYTAGSAINWLQEVGLIAGADELDALTSSSTREDGPLFVPGLVGLAAPFWRPEARGAFLGLSLSTSRADLVKAVLDGIAASIAWLVRAVEADIGLPLARLTVDGGLTRSRSLMQAQADLAQVAIDVYPTPHATAIGVAAMARLAMGDRDGAMQMNSGWTPAAIYEPRMSRDAATERLTRWRAGVLASLTGEGLRE